MRLGSTLLSLLVPCALALSQTPTLAPPDGNRTLHPQQDSAAAAATEARVALVIGNGAYKDAPLKNPVNDARAIGEALQQCGFQVTELENANREQMVQALRDFGGRIMNGGVGLFYYAGHGMQVRGKNYLVPVNADIASEDEVPYNTLDADAVLAKMETAHDRLNLVILDACRNNPFGHSFRGTQQGLAQMDAPAGSYIAFATAPGHTAADGSGDHGLYTQQLLANLRNPGLRVEDVFKRVRASVMQTTKGEQVPWENSSIVGDFYFVPGAAAPGSPATAPNPALPVPGTVTPHPFLSVKQAPAPTAAEAKLLDAIRICNGGQEALAKPLAAKGSIYGQFALGWLSEDEQVSHRAIALGAQQGIPIAMAFLAEFLTETPVSPEDPVEARNWLNKAIQLGEPQAKLILGKFFLKGKLGPQDIPTGERMLAEAARDFPPFCSQVGSFYWNELGDALPKPEAVAQGLAYWRRAVELGDVEAMAVLGVNYFHGLHVPKDLDEAVKWLSMAASRGNKESIMDLGFLYLGLEDRSRRDGEKALQWFSRAAEQGDRIAIQCMADLDRDGEDIPQDLLRALALYRRLAEEGDRDGMVRLGELYEKGLGVPQSLSEAYFWYVLGWDDIGWKYGRERMNALLAPAVRAKLENRAADWRRARVEKGSPGDQYRLGEMYEKGLGVAQSLPQAYFWYVLAGPDWPWGRKDLAGLLPAADRTRIEAQVAKWKPKK
jgi:TPR repeat protein/uncharacterized caspase-like protein